MSNGRTPFSGDYYDSEGNVRNLLELGDAPPDSPKHSMMPFNGAFYASDGSVHNIDEIATGWRRRWRTTGTAGQVSL